MTTSQETQIAVHEQRITALELSTGRIEAKIDTLLERMDTRFLYKDEYEKQLARQNKTNCDVLNKLDEIETTMVTQKQMSSYQKSQLLQKLMTFLGGVGASIIGWVLLFEVSKVIK